jgi:hypothetical protein
MFLRGSGLFVGIIVLLVALLLCSCGGLMMISQEPLTTTEDPAYALGYYIAPVIVCCVPGALLAVVGVLIALFPFAFGRGK